MNSIHLLIVCLAMTLMACTSLTTVEYKDNRDLELPPGYKVNNDKPIITPSLAEDIEGYTDLVSLSGSDEQPVVRLDQAFDRAWLIVVNALESNKIRIIDRNRDKGIFDVQFEPDLIEGIGLYHMVFEKLPDQSNYQVKVQNRDDYVKITANIQAPIRDSLLSEDADDGEIIEDNSAKIISILYKTIREDSQNNFFKAEAKAKQQVKTKTKTKTKTETETKDQVETEAETEEKAIAAQAALARIRARAQAKADAKTKAEAKTRAEARARAEARIEAKARAKARTRVKAEARMREKSRVEAEARMSDQERSEAQASARFAEAARVAARTQARNEAKVREIAKAKSETEVREIAKTKSETEARETAQAETIPEVIVSAITQSVTTAQTQLAKQFNTAKKPPLRPVATTLSNSVSLTGSAEQPMLKINNDAETAWRIIAKALALSHSKIIKQQRQPDVFEVQYNGQDRKRAGLVYLLFSEPKDSSNYQVTLINKTNHILVSAKLNNPTNRQSRYGTANSVDNSATLIKALYQTIQNDLPKQF